MDLHLKDKVVIVTGGGRGIGRMIAVTFAQEGAKVVVADLYAERAQAVCKEIVASGGQAIALGADVSKMEEARKLADAALKAYGRIDALVNNAGAWAVKLFGELTPADWEREINVCYYGTINCVKAVMDTMMQQGSGSIVNIGSDAGRIGDYMQSTYSGAKGAVISFTKGLSKEVGKRGIRVNVVCPSGTMTEGVQEVGMINERTIDKVLKAYPLRKLGKPEDVANMVVFIASDRAGHVTGQAISVNGGYSTA